MCQGKPTRDEKPQQTFKQKAAASAAAMLQDAMLTIYLTPQTSSPSRLSISNACSRASENWPRMPRAINHLVIARNPLFVEASVRKSFVPASRSIFLRPTCQRGQKRITCLASSRRHPHSQAGDSIPGAFALKRKLLSPIFPVRTNVLIVACAALRPVRRDSNLSSSEARSADEKDKEYKMAVLASVLTNLRSRIVTITS